MALAILSHEVLSVESLTSFAEPFWFHLFKTNLFAVNFATVLHNDVIGDIAFVWLSLAVQKCFGKRFLTKRKKEA